MPISINSVRVDQQVKTLLLAAKNESYLADAFLPEIAVKDDSGIIPTWGNAHMRSYNLERSANDTDFHYVEMENGASLRYNVRDFDAAHKVTTKLLEQAADPYNLLTLSAISAREIVKLNRDIALAAQLTNTSVLTTNQTLSGSSQWSHADSTPFSDIETGKDSVLLKTGTSGNAIYLSHQVATKLRQHPDYINLYGLGGRNVPGGVPADAFVELLKQVHNFSFVFIGKTTQITSKDGEAVTRGFVFGKDAVVFHRAEAPSILAPSFGYSFVIPEKRITTDTFLDPATKKFYNVEAKLSFDDKITMPDAAYLFKNAVA